MNLIKTKIKFIKVKVHVECFDVNNGGPAVEKVKVYGNLSKEEAINHVLDYVVKNPDYSLNCLNIRHIGGGDVVIKVPIGDFIDIMEKEYAEIFDGESKSDDGCGITEGIKESGESGESEVGQA